ncbi:MAG: T6SS immunity protein Tdi1 domain-containing protein, partial [Arcobacteraceae bacterium]
IYSLSTAWAELTQIANNFDEYERLANESINLEEWFYKEFVDGQELINIIPKENECLSLDIPLVLSGQLLPDNIKTCDIDVHFSIIGQIHKQIKGIG